MATQPSHLTWRKPFRERALLPGTSPLAAYLLRLIELKRTNLCLSADVTRTSELLAVAEECGDYICLLKTHADIINDFGERTVRGLRAIAQQKRFLIFEDRKFADIGETVRKQYTCGPMRIARWAEITNAHILPGPAIVTALKEGAATAIAAYNANVQTEIRASPAPSTTSDDEDEEAVISNAGPPSLDDLDIPTPTPAQQVRKPSVVSVSTTISTRTENISPQPTPSLEDFQSGSAFGSIRGAAEQEVLGRLGGPPILRGLLLLAEMSSKGHLLTGAYTETCVSIARAHRDFVMGFIAQRSLNSDPEDNFVTMTPGAKLPPASADCASYSASTTMGDSLGQQYTTPRELVLKQGSDVIIVGRGILDAEHRGLEAERYRRAAWEAYEDRIAGKSFTKC